MRPDVEHLLKGIQAGDRLSLSRAITLIETELPDHFPFRDALIRQIEPLAGKSLRLAVTGVPGAGKSTLIDRLGLYWADAAHKVAVLAIDPSSHISQGSILGDKTRMTDLSRHPNAFIRPSPTRLQLGGIAPNTFETILLCEAAGFDRIIVETVGVGQSETLASALTDVCLLLLVTGTGDDLQGVKKGILETADLVLVNKADSGNEDRAKAFSRELKQISSLWPLRGNGKNAQILQGSALKTDLLEKLCQEIDQFLHDVQANGRFLEQRRAQNQSWLRSLIRRHLEEKIQYHPDWTRAMDEAAEAVRQGNAVSQEAARVWERGKFVF